MDDDLVTLQRAIRGIGPGVFLPCWAEPDMWFSDLGADQVVAARECIHACPVQPECLAAAIAGGETAGIWGGVKFPRRVPSQAADR
ncbi:WhiB family transcriptional regulator [Streptomyces sp. NPDC049879]|uniref:WhiB family transcriptional regulator n=1 Tax=Streptomyces sp. NPDC049879 TaxID=3365598 RepID=UPI003789AE9E